MLIPKKTLMPVLGKHSKECTCGVEEGRVLLILGFEPDDALKSSLTELGARPVNSPAGSKIYLIGEFRGSGASTTANKYAAQVSSWLLAKPVQAAKRAVIRTADDPPRDKSQEVLSEERQFRQETTWPLSPERKEAYEKGLAARGTSATNPYDFNRQIDLWACWNQGHKPFVEKTREPRNTEEVHEDQAI